MKGKFKKVIASVLILTVMLSFTGCFNRSKLFLTVQSDNGDASIPVTNVDNKMQSADNSEITEAELLKAINESRKNSGKTTSSADDMTELTRDELELVVDILAADIKVDNLDDDELYDAVDGLLNDIEKTDDSADNSEYYDENGAMKAPFDEAYPELVEDELVEFSDDALLVKMKNSFGGKLTKAMKKAGVAKLEAIVPMEKSTWYKASLVKDSDPETVLSDIRVLNEIQLAEYDYQIKTSAIDKYEDLPSDKKLDGNKHKKEQWYLHHFGIPKAFKNMKTNGGSESVVVAVIDTGVDFDHEDLADNIWKNTGEIPNNNIDDDKNGYVDDYYGVNIVAGKGNGDDDNGHGTHVAGIIAAQNNKLGTVGIAYNTTIMPVKAATASGYLNQSDVAKAILYAYENGAEIINMSFGGTACSIAVQDALAVAYTRCVLVASAGNDGEKNEPRFEDDTYIPNYPAALSYVLGVMSVDKNGVESEFTNWDVEAYNGVEYELYAPGDQVMSTLPNDKYGILSGTSMAAPVVSAFAAIVRSEFSDRDMYPTKFIYGQLASTSEVYGTCLNPEAHGDHNIPQVADLYSALTKLPKPDIGLSGHAMFDTVGLAQDTNDKNNGDGVIDAGETIALGLTLRNRWGMSEDTMVTLDTESSAGVSDPYITINNPTVDYGSVGTYSTGDCGKVYTDELHTGWENPFYITVADDCPNDYIFKLNVTLQYKNALDEKDKTVYSNLPFNPISINLTVRNGVVLPSVIDTDMTLTPDNLYIIPNSTVIEEGVTVTVDPGTNIQFWSNDAQDPYADQYIAYLKVNGNFMVNGTKENPVHIYPSDLMSNYNIEFGASDTGYISLKYADVTNLAYYSSSNSGTENHINYADHCTFRVNYSKNMYCRSISGGKVVTNSFYSCDIANFNLVKNSVFYKVKFPSDTGLNGETYYPGIAERCIFADCAIEFKSLSMNSCVFLGNTFADQTSSTKYYNSTITQGNTSQFPAKDKIYIIYREDTGTTYIRTYNSKISDLLCKQLGISYAKIETEDELNWICNEGPYYNYTLGIKFDHEKQQYVWADGSQIGSFLDPDGILTTTKDKLTNLLFTAYSREFFYSSTYDKYYLYEIQGDILPTDITLYDYDVTIDNNTTYQLSPQSVPAQLNLDRFIYESSDENVVTVSSTGLVTPIGNGTADVYVYSNDRAVKNYVTFNVSDYVALDDFVFESESVDVAIGDSVSLTPIFTPENTTRKNVTYTSSDESVAKVDIAGIVTAISEGSTTITATCEGITKQISINTYVKATSLELETAAISLSLDDDAIVLPQVITNDGAKTELVWRSIDESVATIENGYIVPKNEGTTTLVVTDILSGLSTTAFVIVSQQKMSPVVKFMQNSYGSYALLQNGDLYKWSKSIDSPQLYDQNVKDFSIPYSENGLIILYADNIVQANGLRENFSDKNIVEIEIGSNGNYFAITDKGNVYAWGANQYGELGIGKSESASEPTLVNLDNVKDIHRTSEFAFFLTTDGKVYYSGNKTTTVPVLCAEGVDDFIPGLSNENFVLAKLSSGKITSINSRGIVTSDYKDISDFSIVKTFSSISYGTKYIICIKNGRVYITTPYSNSEITAIPGIYNAIDVYTFAESYYILTEDGLLLGYGSNPTGENRFAGATTQTDVTTPVVIPVTPFAEESVAVTGTSADSNGVNFGENFTATFNKVIGTVEPKLYADGEQITLQYSINNLNELVITRAVGWEENVNYTLTLDANTVHADGGIVNDEAINIEFTYKPSEDIPADESLPVIHESVFDESIERIYTPESFLTLLTETQEKYQFNDAFYNNAILNRTSTDTDVTHWLRILATSTSGEKIPLSGNYWGTTNETMIGHQIVDYADFVNYGHILYAPYLTEAPEDTFPFVTSVNIFNKQNEIVSVVGNEEIKVQITFNRDMDTTIPLNVVFGSAYPYGDYKIEGEYIAPRTWVGTYKLNTLIENGLQYFTISNGCSATDDLVLCTDRARFGFAIDTTAAQALIMQGEASDTGINLTWTQDDFDTLMGYNVYRATSEDGYYTRLNSTVIPADTMEFFDATVEPGVRYYYNFTVVKTDLTESTPSGKITIMSKDTMAPNIYHSPVYEAFTGKNLVISATVTDNLNIASAKVFYRVKGDTEWQSALMNNLNDKYSAIIIADHITTDGLEYYIEAFDGVSYTYKGTADSPYTVTVKEAVSTDSLGDLNGDGSISNLDALMLLKAINDQLNLDSEQFARADLDGDGVLMAKEALRILQYVSGTVGSVNMRG